MILDLVHCIKVTTLPAIETKQHMEVTIIRARTPGSFVVCWQSGRFVIINFLIHLRSRIRSLKSYGSYMNTEQIQVPYKCS